MTVEIKHERFARTPSFSGRIRHMLTLRWCLIGLTLACAMLGCPMTGRAGGSKTRRARVAAAIETITVLHRPDRDGVATLWDGNKYVQCKRAADKSLQCEAAGALMQPTLGRVLTPDKVSRLVTLHWRLDPSFGNYTQTFAAAVPVSRIADTIIATLARGYAADIDHLETMTDWISRKPCPQRNGPGQNLAGLINESLAMARTGVHACTYEPPKPTGPPKPSTRRLSDRIGSPLGLISAYGMRVAAKVQRLRVNVDRPVRIVLAAGPAYIQCEPEASRASIYCEAASPESDPELATILSAPRLARLHAIGFADPGRSQNYWRRYPIASFDDTAIAKDVLTVLHDVYGYNGPRVLEMTTE